MTHGSRMDDPVAPRVLSENTGALMRARFSPCFCSDIIAAPPIRATRRKRGKSLSRRKGQNPKLRIGTRSDGSQYFYFQYWLDVSGKDERSRRREFLGPVKTKSGGLTKTE